MLLPFCSFPWHYEGLPRWLSGKEPAFQCRRHRKHGHDPWVRKIPWSRKWQRTPVLLPGKFYGHRSLVGSQKSQTRLSNPPNPLGCTGRWNEWWRLLECAPQLQKPLLKKTLWIAHLFGKCAVKEVGSDRSKGDTHWQLFWIVFYCIFPLWVFLGEGTEYF